MIGRLQGQLLEKSPPWLMMDVHGVGYELEAPMSTFYALPPLGEPVTLLTHLVVREDAYLLYGFSKHKERELFRDLIRISGVGAKLALAILSGMDVDDFIASVRSGESEHLTRLPGVGKKTAARLVMEMRDRYGAVGESGLSVEPGGARAETPYSSPQEAQRALVALGYKPGEADQMVRRVDEEGLGSEELIRRALKGAGRAG